MINVYVPDPAFMRGRQTASIDPLSGIVGNAVADGLVPANDDAPVLIYYESNRFGAVNIVTFADRCMIAAGRLTQRYPTIARREVRSGAVIRLGEYLPDQRRVVIDDDRGMALLAQWLQQDTVPAAELECSR